MSATMVPFKEVFRRQHFSYIRIHYGLCQFNLKSSTGIDRNHIFPLHPQKRNEFQNDPNLVSQCIIPGKPFEELFYQNRRTYLASQKSFLKEMKY